MNRNDLTNHLLNVAIMASVILAVALYAYYEWQPADSGPPETEMLVPGPVAPQPKVEDHVAAVMRDEGYLTDREAALLGCPACPDCPTYDALKRAGVEIVCTNAFGEVPSVNYWPVEVGMACSRIKKVVIHDKRIEVERR